MIDLAVLGQRDDAGAADADIEHGVGRTDTGERRRGRADDLAADFVQIDVAAALIEAGVDAAGAAGEAGDVEREAQRRRSGRPVGAGRLGQAEHAAEVGRRNRGIGRRADRVGILRQRGPLRRPRPSSRRSSVYRRRR